MAWASPLSPLTGNSGHSIERQQHLAAFFRSFSRLCCHAGVFGADAVQGKTRMRDHQDITSTLNPQCGPCSATVFPAPREIRVGAAQGSASLLG